MATIKVPPVLRPSVGGEKEVSASGDTVGAVLHDLAEQHPATEQQLFGPDGSLNRYVNVYLNDEDVRVLDGLDTGVGRVGHAGDPAGDGRRLSTPSFITSAAASRTNFSRSATSSTIAHVPAGATAR